MSNAANFTRREISRKFQFSGFSLKSDALNVFERELFFSPDLDYDSLDDFVKDVVNVLSFSSQLDFAVIDGNTADDIIKQLKKKRKPEITVEEESSHLLIKNVAVEANQKKNVVHCDKLFTVLDEFLKSLSGLKTQLMTVDQVTTSRSKSNFDCVIFGFIRKNEAKLDGYLLEDSSGNVPIILSEDNISNQHSILLLNSFILVEGTYNPENDSLTANKVGYPPPQIHLKSNSPQATTDSPSRMFVVVREVYLDDNETFKKLHTLLSGYDDIDSPPDCFLFIGPFCADESHFTDITYFKALMRKFLNLFTSFRSLREQSHLVFVPHSECKSNNLIKEPLVEDVIPGELRSEISIHLATNPVHIFIGAKHICVHTGDYFRQLRNKMFRNTTTNRVDYVTAVGKIMLSNAHLTPGVNKQLPNSLSLWNVPNVLFINDEHLDSDFQTNIMKTTLCNAGSFSRDNFKFKVLYASSETIENSQIVF